MNTQYQNNTSKRHYSQLQVLSILTIKNNSKIMKVYSSVRHQKKNSGLNEALRGNLEALSQMLRNQGSPTLSLTPSVQSFDGEGQALILARQFVSSLNDPYRTMLLYPLVIDSPYTYTTDPLFHQTTFPSELHPLLSLYLHKASGYSMIEHQGRRIIDIFYHFVAIQSPQVMGQWLFRNENQSLGQWFFSQCIAGFFQMIYRDKKEYTVFLTNFLRQGIAYLLLAGISALKKFGPPEANPITMERIRLSYIEKYRINP